MSRWGARICISTGKAVNQAPKGYLVRVDGFTFVLTGARNSYRLPTSLLPKVPSLAFLVNCRYVWGGGGVQGYAGEIVILIGSPFSARFFLKTYIVLLFLCMAPGFNGSRLQPFHIPHRIPVVMVCFDWYPRSTELAA